MTDLTISHTHEDGTDLLEVTGELDIATHGRLRDAIHELYLRGPAHVVVDLTATTFLDSVSLGVLIGARRKAHTLRGSFAVVIGNHRVQRIFDLTGLDKAFTTYASVDSWREAARRKD